MSTPSRSRLLLDLVGLTTVARTPYKRLSGGQQQRLSLAAAVIGRPELVFLDEPTAGMDPQARHATWDLIGRCAAAGVSIILTTHFMEEAERLCDHVVIIDHGQLVADGLARPAHRHGGPAQVPRRGRPGHRQPARRAAAGQPAKESPAGHYLIEVPGGRGPAAAGRGDRVVRGTRRAGQQPADREPHAGGRVPRADRKGTRAHDVGPGRRSFTPAPGAAPLRADDRRAGRAGDPDAAAQRRAARCSR